MAQLRSRRSIDRIAVPSGDRGLRSRRTDSVPGQPLGPTELPFCVRRGYEGPQIVINWNLPPVSPDRICLVRKWGEWPRNIQDGLILVDEERPFSTFSYADMDCEAYQVYYYCLFARRAADGVWVLDNKYKGKAFAIPTGYFEHKMWRLLPNVYHEQDGA